MNKRTNEEEYEIYRKFEAASEALMDVIKDNFAIGDICTYESSVLSGDFGTPRHLRKWVAGPMVEAEIVEYSKNPYRPGVQVKTPKGSYLHISPLHLFFKETPK